MNRHLLRSAFTRRDVIIVIAIIGVLLALLLPAIQAARESARQTECHDNLKNIALALQDYHDVHKVFPMGVMHAGPNPGGEPPIHAALGPSWWYGVRPFLDTGDCCARLSVTQKPGGPARHAFCADDMGVAFPELSVFVHRCMRCPSSPLPVRETPTGPIALPSYVGIAGGCDIDPQSTEYQLGAGAPPALAPLATERIYWNTAKGTGATAGGIVTSSGMLPPCQHVTLNDCVDGTADTMIVAEQSDWLLGQNPASAKKYHGDPGWSVGGTGPGGGWLSGTTRIDPVPQVTVPGRWPATWGADCWNVTTVRYPPNFKRVMGTPPLPGCSENHGINNPLQSPHPGGLLVAMVDGSVRFITSTTDLAVLLRLAIRNDGPLDIPD
jgi:hypothetical protein